MVAFQYPKAWALVLRLARQHQEGVAYRLDRIQKERLEEAAA
jgi:hypothetical protein